MNDIKYVLYADDDTDDIELFCEAFKKFTDYKLVTFRNGQELLSFLDQKKSTLDICLIVLDINMPVMDGTEALLRIKKDVDLSHIPTVLFSTAGSPTDKRLAASVDTDIVLKPSNFREIDKTVYRLLDYCDIENHQKI